MSSPFMNSDQIKSNMTAWGLLVRIWPYCRRHLFLCVSVITCILGLAITSRVLPHIFGYAIDQGVRQNDLLTLRDAAIAYLVIRVLQTLFQFFYSALFQVLGNRVLFYVREDLIRHVQSLPIQYFNKTPVGRIVTRLTNDVATLAELFTDGVVNMMVEFITLCSILIAMSFISWKLTLITMALSPFFIWLSLRISDRIRDILRDAKKKLSVLNSYVAENLNGIRVIQLYNRVTRNRNHFQTMSAEYRDLTLDSIRAYALMQPSMNLFNAITISLALYYGGFFHETDSLAIGSLVAFLMHVQDFIPPLREILDKYQQFQNSITSGERVFQVFDEQDEKQNSSVRTPNDWQGEIEFKNLSFQYEPQLPLVLKNLNLKLGSGKSAAIVGRTGSGKSTLISLLQRFYEVPTQSIFIDQIPIEEISFSDLRRHIGVVQQDNYIFRGTIAENVSLGDASVSRDKVKMACERIGYLQMLQNTGRSLESSVEERGANLSVGERQLIAFARILAFEPEILILDEATANIDSENEKIIQRATSEVAKGRTSIIIAHRLSTIQNCDTIVILENGEIREIGTHQELLAKKGLYAQLASAGEKSTAILSVAPGTAVP